MSKKTMSKKTLTYRPDNPSQWPSSNEVEVNTSISSALRTNLTIALILLVSLGALFNLTNVDMWVARLFADGTNGFMYSKHWLTDTVLHVYAARLTTLIALLLIGFNLWQWFAPSLNQKVIVASRYLMLSWSSSLITISILKKVTSLPCPWNLKYFGGTADYLPIYELFTNAYSAGECFPSAHASGGYGLIGIGFIALTFGVSVKKGFFVPILIGLIYGGTQIVRGAHFVSHDLFTLVISLSFAWFWAEAYLLRSHVFFKKRFSADSQPQLTLSPEVQRYES